MLTIHKKLVVDKHWMPMEVIIPWDEYREMEELLGLDLDEAVIDDLRQARSDRAKGKKEVYLDLD